MLKIHGRKARLIKALAGLLGVVLWVGNVDAASYSFSTYAGNAPGSADGTGASARFYSPNALALDSNGNLYVADTNNNLIRKVTPSGVVTTLAGFARLAGSADGQGSVARFNKPIGVAVDISGNVYVADTGNHTIRKITPTGLVSTIAGTAGLIGSANGTGAAALFGSPNGIVVDSGGVLYVIDGNDTLRKITPVGVVTTLAGVANSDGWTDGTGTAARFSQPAGIAMDASGTMYISDTANCTIRKVTSAGVVTTLAGKVFSPGNADGTGTNAGFSYPVGLTVDSGGNVFVADSNNYTIRKVTSGGVVTTFAGLTGIRGNVDGSGEAARFSSPIGIVVDGSGNFFVAEDFNSVIRKITPAGVVSTFVGGGGNTSGPPDSVGTAARFSGPSGVAADTAGNVYVADSFNTTIRKIAPGGIVSTLAGSVNSPGSTDGTGGAARFSHPTSVAVDSNGNVYVADASNSTIRKITSAGVVTTLAGNASTYGHADGTGSAATFNSPVGVAVDTNFNVYVADTYNHTIRKVSPGGVVTTFAGSPGQSGIADGTGATARFHYPDGVAVDSSGNVYVADTDSSTIRKISPAGLVTTLAGKANVSGSQDGTGAAAQFKFPTSVAVDSAGNLYVADDSNETIRMVSPSGVVTTLAGLAQTPGYVDGVGTSAQFDGTAGIAVDATGKLYVADSSNDAIRIGIQGLVDTAVIDTPMGPTGSLRQLDTSPRTATSWSWSVISGPGALTLSSTSIRNPTFTPSTTGQYVIQVTSSGISGTYTSAVSFTVLPPTSTSAANIVQSYAANLVTIDFTAQVRSPAATIQEGIVQFQVKSGSVRIGSASISSTVSYGNASVVSFFQSALPAGVYTIDANYINGANFLDSNDSSHTLTINPVATSISASSASTAYSTTSQNVALSAIISSSGGSVNEGTVTFQLKNGGVAVGSPVTSSVVANGRANVTYSLPAGASLGSYSIEVAYGNGTSYLDSFESAHNLTVQPSSTTTLAANVSTSYSTSGQSIALSATVNPAAGAVNEGTVTFQLKNAGVAVGSPVTSSVVVNGNANVLYDLPAGMSAGLYSIVATYGSGTNFLGSVDSAHNLTVQGGSTTTLATNATASYSTSGQSVALSATVNSAAGAINEGTVTFQLKNGGISVGNSVTSPLVVNGNANVSYNLPAGTGTGSYSILATYGSGTNFLGSVENAHNLTVQAVATTTLAANATATYSTSGQTVALSASVSSAAGVVNEGTVTFQLKSGGVVVGSPATSSVVVNGNATVFYSLPAGTSIGSYSIVATYGSGTNLLGSADSANSLIVHAAATTTTAANVAASYSASSQNVSISAAVTSTAGTVKEGNVVFQIKNGSILIGNTVTSNTVTNGVATANYALPGGLALGAYTLVATYANGSNFSGSSDNSHTYTVIPANTTVASANARVPYSTSAQNVMLSATVSSGVGIVNEGSVTFQIKKGSVAIGTPVTSPAITNGTAVTAYTIPAGTPAGNYIIQAVYANAVVFSGSSEFSHVLTVSSDTSSVSVANTAVSYSTSSQIVTLKATVQSPAGIVNEGTVSFQLADGATSIGLAVKSAPVANGGASVVYILPAGISGKQYNVIASYSGGGNIQPSTDGSALLVVHDTAPAILSGPTAMPAVVGIGQAIQFSAGVAGTNLSYLWDFNDGVTNSNANPMHSYSVAGTYTARLTMFNTVGMSTGSVQITVISPVVGTGFDSDGDGFSDAFEGAVGTDPTLSTSTPLNGKPLTAGDMLRLNLSIASIKLDFIKKANDTVSFTGTIDLSAGFIVTNQNVYIDVSGLVQKFALNNKGIAIDGANSFKLVFKSTKGVVTKQTANFSVKLKGSFGDTLVEAGLTPDPVTANKSPTIVFSLVAFNSLVLQTNRVMSYTAKKGKSGAAK